MGVGKGVSETDGALITGDSERLPQMENTFENKKNILITCSDS